MKTVELGGQGLKVSEVGFGCMSLTTAYQKKLPDEEIRKMLEATYEKGINLWDTANFYVFPDFWRLLKLRSPIVCQEEIMAKSLHKIGRENIVLSTKTGIDLRLLPTMSIETRGDRAFIREQCEASLRRLETDYLDIFYLHRIDQKTPIEVSMLEMKKLHSEGKVKYK